MSNIQPLKPRDFFHVVLFFVLVFLITLLGAKCNAQTYQPKQTTANGVIILLAAGETNGYFTADLHAGYRINRITLTTGYTALINNTQPAIFNLRAGMVLTKNLHVYAGPAFVLYSTDDKSRNYYTWCAGIQYHTLHYDRGTFYIAANYSPGFPAVSVGVSYNLMKEE